MVTAISRLSPVLFLCPVTALRAHGILSSLCVCLVYYCRFVESLGITQVASFSFVLLFQDCLWSLEFHMSFSISLLFSQSNYFFQFYFKTNFGFFSPFFFFYILLFFCSLLQQIKSLCLSSFPGLVCSPTPGTVPPLPLPPSPLPLSLSPLTLSLVAVFLPCSPLSPVFLQRSDWTRTLDGLLRSVPLHCVPCPFPVS